VPHTHIYICTIFSAKLIIDTVKVRGAGSVSVSELGFKTKNMKSLNLLLVIAILCTLFVENECSTFIRAWNVEPCCYRDSQSNDLIQIDPGTGIAETISEPVVSNCEE
jgi:hypothetical protein